MNMPEHLSRSQPARPLARWECWGWEYRDARLPVPIPYGEEPPRLRVPAPGWTPGLVTKASNAERDRNPTLWMAVVSVIILTPMARWVGSHVAAMSHVATLVPVVVAYVAFARPAWLLRRVEAAYTEWLVGCEHAHAQYRDELSQWAAGKAADEQRQSALAARPVWSPLRPVTTERVDVYGGTTRGWQYLLAVTGASLLDSGTPLTVLDLTCDHVARPLSMWAGQTGVRQRWLTCPDEITGVNLLAGLSAQEIGAVVCDAIHSTEPGPPETRIADVFIVQQVAEQLTDQPVTLARLYTALKVLLRQVEPSNADGLSRREARAVTDLLGETARRSAEPRIFEVAAGLSLLATLGGSGGDEPLVHGGDDSLLRVVELSEHPHKTTIDLFRQLVFHVLVHQLPSWPSGAALVMAGADCLSRERVEWLDHCARRRGIRLILLFQHLREDSVDLLGGGDAAVFMRLGNAREAEQAATFIGKEHRFVASQFTVSHSDNTSQSTTDSSTFTTSTQHSTTTGEQWSENRETHFGFLFTHRRRTGSRGTGGQTSTSDSYGNSVSDSHATTDQQGTSTSESVGYQRVHEHTVSPTLLQSLSPTAFLLVDPRDSGSPRLGECDPAVLSEPGITDG